jgi:uncharacterized short protein YbdD (DUF466 family)
LAERLLYCKEVAVTETRKGKLTRLCARVAETARLMVGVPDYDNYVEHRSSMHPGEPIMTYEEFFRERLDARYSIGKGRFRGCC